MARLRFGLLIVIGYDTALRAADSGCLQGAHPATVPVIRTIPRPIQPTATIIRMKVEESELLPGERVILSKPANSIIRLDDYGLGRFPADQLMRVMGFKGKEAIGGRLHLTSCRLLFKSHRVNRVTGSFSIYLPTITGLADRSRWLARKVEVTTRNQVFDFVIWGVPAFIAAVRAQSAQVTTEQARELAAAAQGGMGTNATIVKDMLRFSLEALAVVQNPLDAANLLNLLDLVTDEAAPNP
jgi:hypothetical protein